MGIISGLGNPGVNYANTRHNLGAIWVTRLCEKYNVSLQSNSKLNAKIANIASGVYCIVPDSYMNHSGFAIQKVLKYYKFTVEDLLVVHDDLDLESGVIKLKKAGGHGGHNGLRHIIEQLQANNFARLRIGIGHPKIKDQGHVSDYVLDVPNKSEQLLINQAIERSWQALPELLASNWQQAMQILHTSC